jgi:DNA polymerase V
VGFLLDNQYLDNQNIDTLELRVVAIHRPDESFGALIPAFMSGVQAGFPSPADDYMENQLNINELVVQHPAATFFVRVEGESMNEANIHTGDILVVDRSIEGTSGKIVVAIINGEFTVKRFSKTTAGTFLVPENPKFPPIKIGPDSDFQIWGVVTYVIHKTR